METNLSDWIDISVDASQDEMLQELLNERPPGMHGSIRKFWDYAVTEESSVMILDEKYYDELESEYIRIHGLKYLKPSDEDIVDFIIEKVYNPGG